MEDPIGIIILTLWCWCRETWLKLPSLPLISSWMGDGARKLETELTASARVWSPQQGMKTDRRFYIETMSIPTAQSVAKKCHVLYWEPSLFGKEAEFTIGPEMEQDSLEVSLC